MSESHWAYQYIGLPWETKTYGPHAYDCWGLVTHCLREYYGVALYEYREVPTVDLRKFDGAVRREIRSGAWSRALEPTEGSVVLMSKSRLFTHVGLFTAGRVLHSRQQVGVAFESLTHLRRAGLTQFQFWNHDCINPRT